MTLFVNRLASLGAIVLIAGMPAAGALAQSDAKPKSVPAAAGAGDSVARYCNNAAPVAAEARIAWQSKKLSELEGQLKQRIADLDAKEAEAREWVAKREAMMSAATDDVVAIYAKMDPQAAAAQMAALDAPVAVAILGKLKSNKSSAILGEMEPAKAGELTGLLSGSTSPTLPPTDEKKS
ncbi:MAG: hypothetical protein JO107_03750 [Hyphomicrobiales bacterium]|nr:hypothetical protein [Hyphomicrobiales bacterium]